MTVPPAGPRASGDVVYLSDPVSLNGTSAPDEVAKFEARFKIAAAALRGTVTAALA